MPFKKLFFGHRCFTCFAYQIVGDIKQLLAVAILRSARRIASLHGKGRYAVDAKGGTHLRRALELVQPELLEGAADADERGRAASRHRQAPPLLLTAHLDVVEADPTKWQHPPFSGERARRLPVGPRRDRHEEHGRDVHGDHAPARDDERAARSRHHLRGGRRRGGRLRSRLALPRRAAPREGRGRVRDRRVGRVLAAPRRHDVLSDPGRREGLLLGHARGSPASPGTARCRATTAS